MSTAGKLRGMLCGSGAALAIQQSLPGATGTLVPVIPEVAQSIGDTLAPVTPLDGDAMQILLSFEKGQRIINAIETNICSAILFKAILISGTGFESHLGFFITAIATITEQVKGSALQGRVIAAWHWLHGAMAFCLLSVLLLRRGGRFVSKDGSEPAYRR